MASRALCLHSNVNSMLRLCERKLLYECQPWHAGKRCTTHVPTPTCGSTFQVCYTTHMYTLSAAAALERRQSYLSLTGCNLLGISGLHQVMRVRITVAHPLQLDAVDVHVHT